MRPIRIGGALLAAGWHLTTSSIGITGVKSPTKPLGTGSLYYYLNSNSIFVAAIPSPVWGDLLGERGFGVGYLQLSFNVALVLSLVIFVGILVVLLKEVRPYKNFERGVATLVWAFPASVLGTMLLAYLDTPYVFLSLFGGPGLSSLIVPPGGSGAWRILGGALLVLSVFVSLVTTGVLEATWR